MGSTCLFGLLGDVSGLSHTLPTDCIEILYTRPVP